MSTRWLIFVACLCLAAFVAVAADVLHHGALQQLDRPLGAWMYTHVPAWAVLPAAAVTGLGDGKLNVPLAVIVAALLWRVRRRHELIVWIAACLAHVALINTLKPAFGLPRPQEFNHWAWLPGREGYTFPSGHTMGAVVLYGTLAWIAARLWPARRWLWIALAAAVPLLVGAGLVVVGVHWLSDVLAALALGAAVLAAVLAAAPRPRVPAVSP